MHGHPRAAYEDRDAAREDADRTQDGCAALRARLDDLLDETEDAAARSERQLHEVWELRSLLKCRCHLVRVCSVSGTG